MVENLTSSLTEYVAGVKIPDGKKLVLTACGKGGAPK
jgi:hypothetical protein